MSKLKLNIKHPFSFEIMSEGFIREEAYKCYRLLLELEEIDFDRLESLASNEETYEEAEAELSDILWDTVRIDRDYFAPHVFNTYRVGKPSYYIMRKDVAELIAQEQVVELLKSEGLDILSDDYREHLHLNKSVIDSERLERVVLEMIHDEVDYFNDEDLDDYLSCDYEEEELQAMTWEEKAEKVAEQKIEQVEYWGYMSYLEEFLEGKELLDALENYGILDIGSIAWDMIYTDGVGHFLATYDGHELEIDWENDLVAYRIG